MGNNGQQTATMCNNEQQLTTMDNNGQQWATMCNNGQQWTTMDNDGQQWTTIRDASCISGAVFCCISLSDFFLFPEKTFHSGHIIEQ